jgi:hypothetical protein
MADGQALNSLFRLVRDFAINTPSWGVAVRYQTTPDERFSMPLVARRVYGSYDEFLVIQAAAGIDSPELEMSERLLVLPTAHQLRARPVQA